MSARRDAGALALGFLRSSRFSSVLSIAGIALSATSFAITRLMGWPGYLGALVLLVLLMGLVLVLRRDEIEWREVPPISVLAFLTWATISVIWSEYQWATVGGVAYLVAFTVVGFFIAYTRDTIQIIRAMGDVLRVVLAVSLVLEVFSGLLIDAPIRFLGIGGEIADLGPISGIAQTRNQLGLFAIIGAISFAIEWRTRSVRRLTAILSLVLAALCIGFTQSPVIVATALVIAAAAGVIYGIRHVPENRRLLWQFAILGAGLAAVITIFLLRGRLLSLLNTGDVLDYRLRLWAKVLALVPTNGIEGWGWVGPWRPDIVPFLGLTTSAQRPAASALNAYLDVLFQLGIVGLAIFLGMLGLAFARSWLLAGRRRSVVYAWPALVLLALICISLGESSILADFGWLTFAICSMTASRELSWRQALRAPIEPEPAEAPRA